MSTPASGAPWDADPAGGEPAWEMRAVRTLEAGSVIRLPPLRLQRQAVVVQTWASEEGHRCLVVVPLHPDAQLHAGGPEELLELASDEIVVAQRPA